MLLSDCFRTETITETQVTLLYKRGARPAGGLCGSLIDEVYRHLSF